MGAKFALYDFQVFDAQTCLNVHLYELLTGTATAAQVAVGYSNNVVDHMKDMQSEHVTHTEIRVNNVDDPDDFASIFPETAGIVTGDALPPYCAFAIFWPRLSRASRNGWTRIPGVCESQQGDGVLDGTTLTNLNAIAAFLFGWTDTEIGYSTIRRIWRRPQTPEQHPPDGVEQAFFPCDTGFGIENVSTQNTRKFGRGI